MVVNWGDVLPHHLAKEACWYQLEAMSCECHMYLRIEEAEVYQEAVQHPHDACCSGGRIVFSQQNHNKASDEEIKGDSTQISSFCDAM